MNPQRVDGWCCPCLSRGALNQANRNHCSNFWPALQEGTVVAAASNYSNQIEQCQKEERERKAEAGNSIGREGEERDGDLAAVWDRRNQHNCRNTLGRNRSNSYHCCAVTPESTGDEQGHSSNRGQNGCFGQSGVAQEGADRQGDNRRRSEKASKEGAQQPTLTHKTINQLQKTEKQLATLRFQIVELDEK